MSNWLSRFWDHNRNPIGNAIKNISPFLSFTPLGPLGSLAAGALGEGMEKGANFGSIARSGISNASIGAGAHAGLGALRGAFSGAGSAAGGDLSGVNAARDAVSGIQAPGVANPAAQLFGDAGSKAVGYGMEGGAGGALPLTGGSAVGVARGVEGANDSQGWLGRIGDFAEHHPEAIGRGLQGLGSMATAGSENRLRRAQAQQLEWEMEMQKRREAALEPLRRALAGSFQNYSQPRPIAPNPYAPTG